MFTCENDELKPIYKASNDDMQKDPDEQTFYMDGLTKARFMLLRLQKDCNELQGKIYRADQ